MRSDIRLGLGACLALLLVCSGGMAATINAADWAGLQAAINAAGTDDTVSLATGTYAVSTTTIMVDKAVVVEGNGSTLDLTGGGNVFRLSNGATLQGFGFNKTDTANQDIVYVGTPNVSVLNNTFHGTYEVSTHNETTRAMVVQSGASNVTITGNTISMLRQPGYVNWGSGTISNNSVNGTKGWVIDTSSSVTPYTIAGNTFSGNVTSDTGITDLGPVTGFTDICFIGNHCLYDPVAISAANHRAVVVDKAHGSDPVRVLNVTQGKGYTAIQAAINEANSGDTIKCAAGAYPEEVSITKSVTLSGPQTGVLAKGRTGAEGIVQPASGNAFTVNANNVTIDGFKIMATASASAIDHTGYGVSGLKVLNNTASGGYGVHLFSCSSFQIEGNDLQNSQPVYLNTGFGACTSGTIKNNDIGPADIGININCNPGKELDGLIIENNRLAGAQIALFAVKNAEIKSNTIAAPAASSGIFVGGSCDGLSIDGNTVSTDATPGNSCIRITTWYSFNKGITIKGNQLSDATYGVKVTAGAIESANDLTFTDANTIDGNVSADAVGLWLGGVASGDELNISDMTFGSGLAEFVHLDAWTPGVNAESAEFLGATDDAAIEAKVWHDVDDAALGHVNWGQNGGAPATECLLAVSPVTGSVGQTVQLTAKLTAGGNPLAGQSVAFSVAGTAVASATTDAAGVAAVPYGPLTIGNKTITAKFSGVSPYKATTGTGALTVAAAAPTAITLTLEKPAGTPVTNVVSGEAVTCKVLGDNGENLTGSCTYYAQYGAGGSWSTVAPRNIYTSAKAGTRNITAVYNTLTDSAPLTVAAGAATAVTLTPETATVNVGDAQAYVVTATDAAGNVSTPAAADITWSEDGAGDIAGYTYTAVAGDAGKAVTITATVGGVTSADATLNVNATAGAGTILAWDKDTRKFYLCSNATNPQTGTEITGSGTYDGVPVVVSGTGTNVTVTAAGASLRVTWYLRSGSLYRAYQYSNNTSAGSKTATFDGTRTLVNGTWKSGFYGLTHTISGGSASYGSAQQ
ncbi:MAG: Ig-like domain repeat protein [Armatimonadia bacterium]